MAELPLENLPRRLFACTPTRLHTWLKCPRRYRFAYVDRPTPPRAGPWAHLSLGGSVHLALHEWWLLPVKDRTPEAAAGLVRQVWVSDGFRDDESSDRWRARAAGWVSDYVGQVDATSDPVGLERTVAVRTARLALSGRVDRIDVRDGEAVVVDYKTGRFQPTDVDARATLALAVYALAAQATLRIPCRRVELHHLPTATVAGWTHDERSIQRHLSRAEGIAAEATAAEELARHGDVSDEVFPARPGPGCGGCEFRSSCREGSIAAPAQKPWSVLGDEPDGGGSTGFTVG